MLLTIQTAMAISGIIHLTRSITSPHKGTTAPTPHAWCPVNPLVAQTFLSVQEQTVYFSGAGAAFHAVAAGGGGAGDGVAHFGIGLQIAQVVILHDAQLAFAEGKGNGQGNL